MKLSLRLYLVALFLIFPTFCLAQEKASDGGGPSSVKADRILLPEGWAGPKFLDAADCTCTACNNAHCCPGNTPVPGLDCTNSCSDQHYECGNAKPIVCCQ
jgi:hypothetical protein